MADEATLATALREAVRSTNFNSDYQGWTKYLLAGNLIARMGHAPKNFTYEEKLRFEPETIDWNMEYGSLTYLVQEYLQALEPVRILLLAHLEMPNLAALDLARRIIDSWIAFEVSDHSDNNKIVWYDHCVAERTMLMALYHLLDNDNHSADSLASRSRVTSSLMAHAQYLAADENYLTQNHGTMTDRALYLAAKFFEGRIDETQVRAWGDIALTRLVQAFHRDFSDNMVYLENSANYHDFGLDLFLGMELSVLRPFGDTLGEDAEARFHQAVDFLVYAAQPDKELPSWGDGSKFRLRSLVSRTNYEMIKDHAGLAYLLSDGAEGLSPAGLMKTYAAEGYAFMRSSWETDPAKLPMTASFKSGYVFRNHKHADDLAFTWFAGGREIFVDSGVYTYEAGVFRRHFQSASAHNTVVVDGESYEWYDGDPTKTGILRHAEMGEYASVTGKNDLYPNVCITRTFVFARAIDSLIIVDDIAGHDIHTYSQFFHLSHRFAPITTKRTVDDGIQRVDIAASGTLVTVRQAVPVVLRTHRGNAAVPMPGIVSEGFNDIHETTSLEFSQEGADSIFVTVISLSQSAQDDCKATRRPGRIDVSFRGLEMAVPVGDSRDRLTASSAKGVR